MDRNVIVFPGTTAPPRAGALSNLAAAYPAITDGLAEVDKVCREFGGASIAEYLLTEKSTTRKLNPEEHYLSLMATSLAVFQAVLAEGIEPYAIVGQSIGELWACVAAGGLSVTDGARLACMRSAALTQFGWDGAMMPVGEAADRVSGLVELVDHPHFVIGCVNSPRQTVVSGPRELMPLAGRLADQLGWATTILDIRHPSHSPGVLPAAAIFMKNARNIEHNPVRWRVFSPMLRRWVTEDDHPVQMVADALCRPVYFREALATLSVRGATGFIHCGAIESVEKILRECCPGVAVVSPCMLPIETSLEEGGTLSALMRHSTAERCSTPVLGPVAAHHSRCVPPGANSQVDENG